MINSLVDPYPQINFEDYYLHLQCCLPMLGGISGGSRFEYTSGSLGPCSLSLFMKWSLIFVIVIASLSLAKTAPKSTQARLGEGLVLARKSTGRIRP